MVTKATPLGVLHSATAYHGHVTFAERFALRREDRDHRIHRNAFGGTENGWGKNVFEIFSPQNLDIWNVDVCQLYARRSLSLLLSVPRECGLRCLPWYFTPECLIYPKNGG